MIYLHALVGELSSLKGLKGHGGRLRLMDEGKLLAVAEERPDIPPGDTAHLLAQDELLRELRKRSPSVLPFRYGTVLADADDVRAQLSRQKKELAKALKLVTGCVQMTVTIEGDRIPEPPAAPKAARSGRAYLEARRSELAFEKTAPELKPLASRLHALVREERVRRVGKLPVLAKVFHLIPEEQIGAYGELFKKASLPGVRLKVTGPHPAYAFGPESES